MRCVNFKYLFISTIIVNLYFKSLSLAGFACNYDLKNLHCEEAGECTPTKIFGQKTSCVKYDPARKDEKENDTRSCFETIDKCEQSCQLLFERSTRLGQDDHDPEDSDLDLILKLKNAPLHRILNLGENLDLFQPGGEPPGIRRQYKELFGVTNTFGNHLQTIAYYVKTALNKEARKNNTQSKPYISTAQIIKYDNTELNTKLYNEDRKNAIYDKLVKELNEAPETLWYQTITNLQDYERSIFYARFDFNQELLKQHKYSLRYPRISDLRINDEGKNPAKKVQFPAVSVEPKDNTIIVLPIYETNYQNFFFGCTYKRELQHVNKEKETILVSKFIPKDFIKTRSKTLEINEETLKDKLKECGVNESKLRLLNDETIKHALSILNRTQDEQAQSQQMLAPQNQPKTTLNHERPPLEEPSPIKLMKGNTPSQQETQNQREARSLQKRISLNRKRKQAPKTIAEITEHINYLTTLKTDCRQYIDNYSNESTDQDIIKTVNDCKNEIQHVDFIISAFNSKYQELKNSNSQANSGKKSLY